MTTTLAPATVPSWRAEPFRIFFPLAMVIGSYGVGHWIFYQTGLVAEYSCLFHGMIQTQAFVIALALGFLLTAIPRRTQSAPATVAEIVALAGALFGVVVAATVDRWVVAEVAYVAMLAILLRFAVRRFRSGQGGRRPPAAFVVLPIGLLHGFAGAVLLGGYFAGVVESWAFGLGRLCVEQGVVLCLAIGAGNLVLPLMSGATPPADLGSSPRETWRAVAFAGVGATVFASLVAETRGATFWAPVVRGVVVALALPDRRERGDRRAVRACIANSPGWRSG